MTAPGQLRISNDMSRRKLHILSVIDDLHFGGDEYRLYAFAKSLDKCRFDHTILTLMKENRTIGVKYGSMRDQYRQAGIRLIDIGQPAAGTGELRGKTITNRLFSAWEKSRRLASLIREEKVDVLDVHLSPANPVCAVAALNARIPFAVTLYQVNTMQSPKLWLAGQFNLGSAAMLITDSASQAAVVSRWLMHRPPIHVVPNGTSPPQPVQTKQTMFKLFNIPDRPLTIIGEVSSLISYKGHLVLLNAAKRVLERHPECFFLIVGYERSEEGYRELLLRHADSLGIADQVRIEGYPGPIGDVWNIIDIHVHASQLDSLPNALLEAMSLGKPSVITSVGGVPEVVEHKVNGFLVAPNDSEQLAEGLLLFMGDPSLGAAIGREAQSTYVKHFCPQVMTRRLEEEFEDIVLAARKRAHRC
jgi:glycosyltransferase involved in cell wall biosynthesis